MGDNQLDGDGKQYADWAAGRHWREAMAKLAWANKRPGHDFAGAEAAMATAHLAAAKLLLDHDPEPFAHLHDDWVEPPEDWRRG